MEKVPDIIMEIRKKEGRIWLGLMATTEQQLNELMLYLGHPTLQEDPKKIEELVNLYITAKESGWRKMEGIKRKLEQLRITLGKPDDIQILTKIRKMEQDLQTKIIIDDYPIAINDLKQRIEGLLGTTAGKSLPEKVQESIINFLHYLNHKDLSTKYKQLFNEMLEKYNAAEEVDFTRMQSFNDTLIKVEIKLGKVTDDLKIWKSQEEIQQEKEQELDEKKESIQSEKEKIEAERVKIRAEWAKLLEEQEKLRVEREDLEREKVFLEGDQMKLASERKEFEAEKKKLEQLRKELEAKEQSLRGISEPDDALRRLKPPK